MTLNGLRRNGETAALLSAENAGDTAALRGQWETMWDMGSATSQAMIDEYRSQYQKAKAARRVVVALKAAPAEPDPEAPLPPEATFDGADPSSATIGWTEAGSPSAGGLDLEFPRELMPFFALPQAGGMRRFRTPNGSIHSLRFTYRDDNKMWRLLLSADSVDDLIGRRSLRPGPHERSEFALTFARAANADEYGLAALRLDSLDFQALIQETEAVGGLRSTKGNGSRKFGFL